MMHHAAVCIITGFEMAKGRLKLFHKIRHVFGAYNDICYTSLNTIKCGAVSCFSVAFKITVCF